MMKLPFAVFLLSLLLMMPRVPVLAQAQHTRPIPPSPPTHYLSFEAIAISSVNFSYEYRMNDYFRGRTGITSIPTFNPANARVGVPLMASFVAGGEVVKVEVGGGAIFPLGNGSVVATGVLAIRFEPRDYGLFGSLGWRPVFMPTSEDAFADFVRIFPLLGVGARIGYCF
ncbi:MAG: hypothetical protein JST22_16170 [Bacteroidetes bacterium]|nr:hypothetical protein [Bacteroidota bacterium]